MKDIPEIEKRKDVVAPDYTEDEQQFLARIISDAVVANNQRQIRWTELDDVTIDENYITNAKAANGYIPPKTNMQDVRVVSGTTREKVGSLVSALLNYNLEADVEAFDPDDMPLKDVGETLSDAIEKSRKIESPDYDTKRPLIYQEFVSQGTAFVLERFVEYSVIRKTIDDMDVTDMMKVKWEETTEKVSKLCDSKLLCGLNVFLGNERQPYIELQPFIILRDEISRSEAESRYGDFERWENVPYQVTKTTNTASNNGTTTYNSWTMIEPGQDMVEEVMYFNKWTNTYQIMLNGVMMLPIGFPLEFLTGQIEYPIAMGVAEPIPFFARGRGTAFKAKVPQAVMDEMMKAMVLATRRSYNPSMANNTGVTLNKRIFYPGEIIENIDPAKLQPIGDVSGVTPTQYKAMEFVKSVIDESSVSALFQGNTPQGANPTARQVVEQKQQTLMKLGLLVLGIINLEKKMAWLRLVNILRHWTRPEKMKLEKIEGKLKKVFQYQQYSMDTSFDDGETGTRLLEFTDQQLPEQEQVDAESQLLTIRRGMPIKKTYMNVHDIVELINRLFIVITPKEKDSGELRKASFRDSLTTAFQLFGPQAISQPYAQKVWANYEELDADKFFQQQGQMQLADQAMNQQGQGQQAITDQLTVPPLPKPSVNTMVNS